METQRAKYRQGNFAAEEPSWKIYYSRYKTDY